jgi:hypothetical protein
LPDFERFSGKNTPFLTKIAKALAASAFRDAIHFLGNGAIQIGFPP